MRETLTLIGVVAVAAAIWVLTMSLWYLRGQSDKKLLDANNETIASLQDIIHAKEDIIAKNKTLLDTGNATIKSLQDTVQTNADTLGKDKASLDAKDEAIKSLQNDLQTKEDTIGKDKVALDTKDNAISLLQDALQSKEADLAKDNQLISSLQAEVGFKQDEGNKDVAHIYPKDNGFEDQDLGAGFSAYQVYGPIKNPNNVLFPVKIPNQTPWKFGDGNSGVAANNSGLFVTNATNQNHDGARSTSGQAAFLEYKGSSISQSIKLPAGTYSVSFDYEARRDYLPANQIAVSIDGTILFQGAPIDCNNFTEVTTRSTSLKKTGNHELKFLALGSVGDLAGYPCVFIDNIVLNHITSKTPATKKGDPDSDKPHHTSVGSAAVVSLK